MKLSLKQRKLLSFGTIWFLVFFQVPLGYLLLVKPYLHGDLFYTQHGATATSISDFIHFYSAGAMALSADSHQVYQPEVQLRWINTLIRPACTESVFYMQYVPFVFPLMAPFALLSMTAAYFLWLLLSALCGLIGMVLIAKSIRHWNKEAVALFALSVFASFPSALTLKLGQTTWFMLALISGYYWALLGKADLAGGICLALTTLKPQYTVLFAIPGLALRRWRLIVYSIITETILLLLAGITIGWQNVVQYPMTLLHAETSAHFWGVLPEHMISVRALLSLITGPQLALRLSILVMLAAAGAVYVLWRRAASLGVDAWHWAFAITVLLSLIASPHSHPYDSLLLALPAGLTLGTPGPARGPGRWIWSALLITFPLTSWTFYQPAVAQAVRRLPFLLLNLVLLACASASWLRLVHSRNGESRVASV